VAMTTPDPGCVQTPRPAMVPEKLTVCATENGRRSALGARGNIDNPSKASPFTGDLSVERSAGNQRTGRGLIRQRNGVAFCFPFNLPQRVPQLLDYG
jgi:hypothetical protein